MLWPLFFILFWAAREQETIEASARKVNWDVEKVGKERLAAFQADLGGSPPTALVPEFKLDGGPPPKGGG